MVKIAGVKSENNINMIDIVIISHVDVVKIIFFDLLQIFLPLSGFSVGFCRPISAPMFG